MDAGWRHFGDMILLAKLADVTDLKTEKAVFEPSDVKPKKASLPDEK